MKDNKTKFAFQVVCVSAALVAGCATQPVASDQQTTEAASRQFVTGSRLTVRNTTELIGVKTIDKNDVRNDKMFTPIIGGGGN